MTYFPTSTCLRCQEPLFFRTGNWWSTHVHGGTRQEANSCQDPFRTGHHVPVADRVAIEKWLAA